MKYRIAIVLDFWDYSFNGTTVSTRRFIHQLEKNGYEFVILATGKESPNKVTFKPLSWPFIRWILDKMRSPLAIADEELIRQTLKDCDLVHVHLPFFLGAKTIKVANEMGVPVVSSFHVQPENVLKNLKIKSHFLVGFLYKVFIKHFYSKSDVVICPSSFAEKMLKKNGLKTPTKILSNGIPDKFLRPPKMQRYMPRNPYHLLSVGRLASEKHQDIIIRAVAGSRFKDQISLTIVGAGPSEAYIKKQARLYLPGNCKITSVSDDELLRLYRTADLFIHAGEIELEGMSVMEAMASSLPIIVSDSKDSAAKDFARNEQSLFKFPDENDLIEKIDYWLSNPKARAEIAALNYEHAKKYSHAASCYNLENIYRQQLNLEALSPFDQVDSDTPYKAAGLSVSGKL